MNRSAPPAAGDGALAARLRREIEGEVLFDAFSRGRYSTDASIYRIEPVGVVVPRSEDDIVHAIQVAADAGVPVLPRGAGSSQCGQTVGEALVVDVSKHLDGILEFDAEALRATVQPGVVLDRLNAYLKPHGLFFPVDVSTSAQATIGGMTGNNSCGARSIRYGNMVHNVHAIDAVLADGAGVRLGPVPADLDAIEEEGRALDLARRMRLLGEREADEIARRFPKLLRRVGGYNIETISPQGHNMAHLLVGSEGTLAFFRRIEVDLQPIPPHKVLGVCHFPTFFQAMEMTRHIVALEPAAVELVDRTMIDLARDIAAYRPTIEDFVEGAPDALLLVEFAGEDAQEQRRRLADLVTLMADHGFPGAVRDITDAALQGRVWAVRKAGLNIMMSMKGDGKPISFIEDCAVALDDLADYTDRLTRVFAKHGTRGTWYAHASVGCLHVRPVLNMKDGEDVKKMRAIAEEAFAMVRQYKGSHSGEHGDGLVRSEFLEPMLGPRIVQAFADVKDAFDPEGRFNPGKIVDPKPMDDRALFRYPPDYAPKMPEEALDWSEWGGFAGAVEMCNNNGECRKRDAGVMCPSYRATGDEIDLTRGRANTLRLALAGQLGADALTSDAMAETMELCVGCKACKRECPTGVDMARMKTEFLYHYRQRHGLGLGERMTAFLPRYAPWAARLAPLFNLLAGAAKPVMGISARRSLPSWHRDRFGPRRAADATPDAAENQVVLLADTFNTYFEPENVEAAVSVLEAAGFAVRLAAPPDGGRPLCCGRTFLAAGLVDEARAEARRTIAALGPFVERGVPVIGLEPSCLLTLRDEFTVLDPGDESRALAAGAQMFEEFLAGEAAAGRLRLNLKSMTGKKALLHGHCHQRAFDCMAATESTLALVPGLEVETVQAGCCGMAGAFGYQARHFDLSMRMAEMDLLPALRAAEDALIVADGTSCRHQIKDGAGRPAVHVARVLADALMEG
ncbi:MAG: FAD-linked oxidase C-terminal domain-containing protein [Rhodospirillales bacterium]|nr:FAD-linked oxidase C-terminal domain-containing protein [Rhodospirillales bacterium]